MMLIFFIQYSVEYEWSEGMFPLSAAPKGKKCFLPSKYERIAINKLVLIFLLRFKLLNLEDSKLRNNLLKKIQKIFGNKNKKLKIFFLL